MCTTCGCSDDARPRIDGKPVADEHSHEHAHEHSHEHAHEHAHEHSHEHSHEHAHGEIAHSQAHTHSHSHSHTHSHTHPDVHDHEHSHDQIASTRSILKLEEDILSKNNLIAAENRDYFAGRKVLAINLVSSPGSGKTSLLEVTIKYMATKRPIAVIEGDQETDNDAKRIRDTGVKVVQINTGSGCHLEADSVSRALHKLDPEPGSIVFIENVGNLVCPALFDLGEASKVAILSVTEGEDKPLKYPHMFRASTALIINKIDLLPYLKFDIEKCMENALKVNPKLKIFCLSAQDLTGMDNWYNWLKGEY